MKIPSSKVQRKPVKKWVARRFSRERLARLADFSPFAIERMKTRTARMLEFAERLLSKFQQQNGTLIFIGRATRPLFEVVRGLNEIEQSIPRQNIRYIVIPTVKGSLTQKALTKAIRLPLQKRRIISEKRGNKYYIIDETHSGTTLNFVKELIRKIKPSAEVFEITQHSEGFWGLMNASTTMPIPTTKDAFGKQTLHDKTSRTDYLLFQKLLQEALAERARKKEIKI